MMNPEIYLSEPNPQWQNQFAYQKKRIINAIGKEIIGIEHIGSTSIPRLMAKPIIDLMFGIKDVDDVAKLIAPLAEFEYVPKLELVGRYFFRKGESKYAFDRSIYTLKKEPFIKEIIEKAKNVLS
ncbi:GrpB family protein [Halalkalibacter suaedae]|uniref:GrpB family protein n=1 Tax=Halalkalibacter suaedae TaxID=2822140 RepID=A0A941APJ3_9BACI|nr:GrpB family protein [Bacillus suaedae]MBP3951552.1 GrpB family protein [Bacillus suaedae]